jgi:hypothetical protein
MSKRCSSSKRICLRNSRRDDVERKTKKNRKPRYHGAAGRRNRTSANEFPYKDFINDFFFFPSIGGVLSIPIPPVRDGNALDSCLPTATVDPCGRWFRRDAVPRFRENEQHGNNGACFNRTAPRCDYLARTVSETFLRYLDFYLLLLLFVFPHFSYKLRVLLVL